MNIFQNFKGDLTDEAEVLEWLIQQQSTVGDEDIVESVDMDELDIMMRNVDYLLVLYHDRKKRSQKALSALGTCVITFHTNLAVEIIIHLGIGVEGYPKNLRQLTL